MFRAVAVCCDIELQSCSRSLLGWPSVSSLAVKETQAADKLREKTVMMLRENAKLFHSSWRDMGMDVNFDADYDTLDSRLTEMSNPSTYGGEPELLALTHVIKQPIVVYNLTGEVKFGEAFDEIVPAVHLRYSPEKQGKANQAASPGHYDALIDELYPKVGDFIAVRAGRNKWYPAQALEVDHSIPEVKVTFMKPSGSAYVFTDGKPSWIDLEKIIHICIMR